MFLNPIKSQFQKISFRLSFIFGLLFFSSSISVLLISYFLFNQSLKLKDQDTLRAKAKQYAALYNKNGQAKLHDLLVEEKESDEDSQYLIVVRDKNQKNILTKVPESKQGLSSEFDLQLSRSALNKSIADFSITDPGAQDPDEDNTYEVIHVSLSDDSMLFVGRSTGDREDLLERYLSNLLTSMIIVFFVGIFGAYYFSTRALSPLRHLIQTVRLLYSGDFKARVPVQNSNDELDQIGQLFNKMAAKIEKLIIGMQETLDQVAHELKTPLTRLKANSELALLSEFSESDARTVLASGIEDTAEIVSLIDTIMDISEAQVGILQLNLKPLDLKKELSDVIDLYQILAEEKSIVLISEIGDNLTSTADANRFKQVISNLISNSIKYSKRGTLIKIIAYFADGKIIVQIEDQGIGISEEDLPKIWNRLFRSEDAKSEKGLGLGLSLVQSICKAHGWTIEVESTKSIGTRVNLFLTSSA